jgi:hypothetical protein
MCSRYVVYFEPTLVALGDMDNRMSSRLDSQIRDFLTAWRASDAFTKQLQSHLWQFKWSPRQGSGARAFAGYFDGGNYDIALVLVAFKKKNERTFNAAQGKFNERSKSLTEDVLGEKTEAQLDSWLKSQHEDDSRNVLPEDDASGDG